MKITIFSSIVFLFGIALSPTIASYINKENTDKTYYRAVNSISDRSETTYTTNSKISGSDPTKLPCSTECPLEMHSSNGGPSSFERNIGMEAAESGGNRRLYYPRFLPIYPQLQGSYLPGQIDPGFARFPPPQQGGPMINYFPPPQGSYLQPSQRLTPGQPTYEPNFGQQFPNEHHQNHLVAHTNHDSDSKKYYTSDHSLKSNTDFKEVGSPESSFEGNSNGLGYGSSYDTTQSGTLTRNNQSNSYSFLN